MSAPWWVLDMDDGVRSGPHSTKRAAIAEFAPADCPRRVHRYGPGAYEVEWWFPGARADNDQAFVEQLDPDLAGSWQWALDEHMAEELEDAYAAVTDELNDGSPGQLTLDDLSGTYVSRARRYAEREGLPWPPGVGDFDRYCERRWEIEERARRVSR